MVQDYFAQLATASPTRVWVNNPTLDEIELAIAAGAVGCTTNPAFGGNQLRRVPAEIEPIIETCAAQTDDDAAAADLVQQQLVVRIAKAFLPLFESSGGTKGFVSIQGAPEADTDPDRILAEAHDARAILPNVTPKLPATAAGLTAFEQLVGEGHPVIVTEVFSLAQLVETCERYVAVTDRTGVRPPFFMSPITGIFGDHLKAISAGSAIAATRDDMEMAGVALSRACQKLVEERRYPVRLLCGGARIPFDLTGLVGAAVDVTINWSTFAEVIASDDPFELGIDRPIDPAVVARLIASFDDVRRAFALDGLTPDEFDGFPPVQHFRNLFVAGWQQVHAAVAAARPTLVVG